ncbi:MAG: AMP-binding protein [Dehalococcoidia bacterium]|nr:AMP-binding protein [Dehalococcoidia bacterium]
MMLEGCIPWPEELVKRYTKAGYWEGRTLGEMLDEAAEKHGPREAVVGDPEGRYTFNELKKLSDRLALHLLEVGLKPKDRVLVQLINVPEFVILYFALQKAGLIPVLALPQHRLHEMGFFAELSEARAYCITSRVRNFDYGELARQVQEKVPSVQFILAHGEGEPAGSISLNRLLADPIEERVSLKKLQEVRPDPGEVAMFLLSGGTTGLPKLIPRTHNDYIYNSKCVNHIVPYNKDTVYLVVLPIEHNYPLVCGLQPVMMLGGKTVLCTNPDTDHVLQLIEKEKVTVLPMVPSLLIRFMNHPNFRKYDTSSLKLLVSGAQKLQPELKPKVEVEFKALLMEAFGMAEGLLTFSKPDAPLEMRLQTVGLPVSPGDEIGIVDEQGKEVPEGEIGELICQGPYTLRGYYKAPEHNKSAFNSEGYYLTGDLMRRGPYGGLVVEGRRKDMINRGGEHLSAEEIENLIITHPAVHNVAVIGMPDPDMGERICAYIIPRPGQSITFQELSAFLLGKDIAKFKLPERLELVSEFPLTNIGKVSKKDLREDIAKRLQAEKAG